MSETKPLLLFRKYRSLFNAALTIELVLFSVTLTDTVVAANAVGEDALSAVGLLAPFIAIAQFMVARIIRYVDFRSYVMTTGYNRHEFFFREGSAG